LIHSIVKEQVLPGQLEGLRTNANTTDAIASRQTLFFKKFAPPIFLSDQFSLFKGICDKFSAGGRASSSFLLLTRRSASNSSARRHPTRHTPQRTGVKAAGFSTGRKSHGRIFFA
jgi:hypothetical protein